MLPELWIAVELIGASFEMVRNGRRVEVRLPGTEGDFSALPESISHQALPSLVKAGPVFQEPGRDSRTAGVLIVEVAVETETDVSSPKPLVLTDELRSIVEGDLRAGQAIADEVAHELTRHFRAAAPRQTWLGLAAHQPQQYGVAALENRDTGEFIFGLGAAQTTTVRSSHLRLEDSDFARIAAAVSAGTGPSIAESLLADAFHLSDADAMNDRDRAWIVAATACEVRAKEVLRSVTSQEDRDELDSVLRRRSNVTDLVDSVWANFAGTSLRRDDPELFRKTKILTSQRNRLVHAGKHTENVPPAMDPAVTAQLLFAWMAVAESNARGEGPS